MLEHVATIKNLIVTPDLVHVHHVIPEHLEILQKLLVAETTVNNKSDISYLNIQLGLRTFPSIQVLSWQPFQVG